MSAHVAVVFHACPVCGAAAGRACMSPSGKAKPDPRSARLDMVAPQQRKPWQFQVKAAK